MGAYFRAAVVFLFATLAPASLHAAYSLIFYDANLFGAPPYECVQVPANASLTPTQITLEAWVNAATGGTIISRGDGSTTNTDYILQISNDGASVGQNVSFYAAGVWNDSIGTIPTNTWTHVAVTYDGTNKQFYINGVLSGTSPCAGSLSSTPSSPLYLGVQGFSCACNEFLGELAEVRLWSTVRTASQIQADMNFSFSGVQPGLLAYYHLNEGVGSTAHDVSGNGHDGTVQNAKYGVAWAQSAPPSLGWNARAVGPGAGTESVVLCGTNAWTNQANASWLHLSAPNQTGTGSANIIFTYDANTGAARTGTLTIAGLTLTVTQAGTNFVSATGVTTLISGMNSPVCVGVDGVGNVYAADAHDPVTGRKWSKANNTVSTLFTAGTNIISGAVDSLGNFYIDYSGSYVDKWSAASQTQTYIFEPTNDTSSYDLSPLPLWLGVDGGGNVFYSDQDIVGLWFAGSGNQINLVSSGITQAGPLAEDQAGNVYILDYFNYTLKEWVAQSNSVFTLCTLAGVYLDESITVDGGGNVYIGDPNNGSYLGGNIIEWSAVTKTTNVIYAPPITYTSQPWATAVDGAGNIYFTEFDNGLVRELPRAFVGPTTKSENAAAGSDSLMVLPATENLQPPFAPTSDQPWLSITGATNGIVTFACATNFGPTRAGNITVLGVQVQVTQSSPYILGTANRTEGPAAGTDSVVLGVQPAVVSWTATPNAPWLHLSAANQSGTGSTNLVFSFDANSGGTRTGAITVGNPALSATQTLTVTQTGSTYVAATPWAPLVSVGLNKPNGVAVDTAGNVYIADTTNNAIKKWSMANNTVSTLVSSGLGNPGGVAVDSAGNVYIADTTNNAIKEWSAANQTVSTLVSGLSQPNGVAVDSLGNVYIADTGNNAIKEWVAASNSVFTLGSIGAIAPRGVAVDAAGNVYISDTGNNTIKEWFAASHASTKLVTSGLSSPGGLAVDGAGNVYIADVGDNAIKEWIATSKSVVTLFSSGLTAPASVAVDGNGNTYVADTGNSFVKALQQAFVDPTPKLEIALAGVDALPPVLPVTENLLSPFAPTSDQSWLTINSVAHDAVGFAFTQNGGTIRTGHINLLGQSIPVTQYGATGVATSLTGAHFLPNGKFQFTYTNNPGATFNVLSTTNITLPLSRWISLGAPVEGPAGQYQFTDTNATTSARYYILRTP